MCGSSYFGRFFSLGGAAATMSDVGLDEVLEETGDCEGEEATEEEGVVVEAIGMSRISFLDEVTREDVSDGVGV